MAYSGWGTGGVETTNNEYRTAYSGWGKEPYRESWRSIRFKDNQSASQKRLAIANDALEQANAKVANWQMVADLPKDIYGTTKAVGADIFNMLTPWRSTPISQVSAFGKTYQTPSAKGREAGQLVAQGQYKKGFGKLGEAGLDIASTVYAPGKVLGQFAKGSSILRGALEVGVPTGIIGAGYGASGAAQEGKKADEILKQSLTSGAFGLLFGGTVGGAIPAAGKAADALSGLIKRGEKAGLKPEVLKVIQPEATPKVDSEVPKPTQKESPFVKTLDEKKGMYSSDEKKKLYEEFIKPKEEKLGNIADDETVVYYQGEKKPGQYVNTNPSEVWHYNVDKDLNVEKVKKSELKTTGDATKDEVGYRLLSPEEKQTVTTPVTETTQQVPKEKPIPTGNKESRFYQRAKEKVELGLKEDVRYTTTTRKEQAEQAIATIKKDEKAATLRGLYGKSEPDNLTDTALRLALIEKARDAGDDALAAALYKRTSLEATRFGQENSMLRGAINDNDPSAIIRQVIRQRLQNAKLPTLGTVKELARRVSGKGKSKSARLDVISEAAEKQQKRIAKTRFTLDEVQKFVDEITCK